MSVLQIPFGPWKETKKETAKMIIFKIVVDFCQHKHLNDHSKIDAIYMFLHSILKNMQADTISFVSVK